MSIKERLLEKKIISPDDPDYHYVPLIAVWRQKCPLCDSWAVCSSRIGLHSRFWAHYKRCRDD